MKNQVYFPCIRISRLISTVLDVCGIFGIRGGNKVLIALLTFDFVTAVLSILGGTIDIPVSIGVVFPSIKRSNFLIHCASLIPSTSISDGKYILYFP